MTEMSFIHLFTIIKFTKFAKTAQDFFDVTDVNNKSHFCFI